MSSDQTYRSVFYSASDGLRLHVRLYGESHAHERLPVVCLPGLTRNAADFHELALFLSAHPTAPRMVAAFDYRGRGRSAYDPDWKKYDVMVESGDVIAGLTAIGIEHAGFIGTSRGGIIIHVLAAMRPGALKAVVLNDIGPAVDVAGLAQIKAYLEKAPQPKSFEEAVAIQRAAHGAAFTALTDADWQRLVRALYRDEAGRPVADFDPKLLDAVAAMDLSKPLPELWPQFMGLADIPTLAIRGANSKLLTAATLVEMERRHPRLEAITVAGQGHAPLLETGELPERIAAFLARAELTGR